MKIAVKDKLYDIRYRQDFVKSLSGKQVRRTEASISAVDRSQSGAKQYTSLYSVVLTQNVKDKDNKYGARKRAIARLIGCVFDKETRKNLWENVLLKDANIVGPTT